MDYTYAITAAEIAEKNGAAAERSGSANNAIRYYRQAVENLRSAASSDPNGGYQLLRKAKQLEERISALENAPRDAGAVQASRPPVASAPPKSEPYLNANTIPANKNVPGNTWAENDDYSDYDFGVGQLVRLVEKVTFDDIIGMEDVKNAIRNELFYPLSSPEIYERYGLRAGGYTLLWGPPGTGKTTFAKAVACQLSDTGAVPFINVSCGAMVKKYVGESGECIRKLFSEVRRLISERNTAVVLFLDEIDEIAKDRSLDDKASGATVPSLLRELEGFDTNNKNLILIAATNVMDQLDKAILSRFNNKIFVPLPDEAARRALFALQLKKHKIREEDVAQLNIDGAAGYSEGMSGREITQAVEVLARNLAARDSGHIIISEPLDIAFRRYIDQCRPNA